jgi:(p)ppGpp synthase/HD superfamily hydrolase
MQFFVKHLYLLAPILAILALFGVYRLIKANDRPIPHYEPKQVEDTWSAEEYMRHLNLKPFNQREVHRLLLKRTRQKEGVYLESLLPVMDTAGLEIIRCYHKVMGDDYVPVITSGNDYPYHKKNSKHYKNAAMDFRIVDMPMDKRRQVVEMAQDKLGPRFKVLWEKGEMEHLHVELIDSEL